MATMADVKFWTERKRALGLKVSQTIDQGEAPPAETCLALREVSRLLDDLTVRIIIDPRD